VSGYIERPASFGASQQSPGSALYRTVAVRRIGISAPDVRDDVSSSSGAGLHNIALRLALPNASPSRSSNQKRQNPDKHCVAAVHGVPFTCRAATQLPAAHEPPACDEQGVPSGRWFALHWPCVLQVSCPEQSVAPEPQDAPVFALKAEALRAGSQT
jgi:hypothetical protein